MAAWFNLVQWKEKLKHLNLFLTTLGPGNANKINIAVFIFLSKPECLIQVLISLFHVFAHML